MVAANPSPPDASPPSDPGSLLRAAREARGAALAEAARATKIPERYLRALEEGAPLEEFPGRVYARFFLREYARYLAIPEDEVVRAQEAWWRATEEPPIEVPQPVLRSPGPWPARLLVVAALAVLAVVAVVSLRPREQGPVAETPSRVEAPSPTPSPSPSPERAPARPRGIRAVLAAAAPSWVEATVDGEVEVYRVVRAGERVQLRARRTLLLTLGNAGGVELRVNGKPVPTGASGEVVHLSFAWKGGKVRSG
jgi:cytoskeleton protein RodZ